MSVKQCSNPRCLDGYVDRERGNQAGTESWVEQVTCQVCSPDELSSEDIIEQFNAGVGFAHRDGRRVVAVIGYSVGPSLILGKDEDQIGVQFAGVDYGGDYWDAVLASDLIQL